MTHSKARGYNVAGRRSAANSKMLICHLEDIGFFDNTIQRADMFQVKGCKTLTEWVSINFPGVDMVLFD